MPVCIDSHILHIYYANIKFSGLYNSVYGYTEATGTFQGYLIGATTLSIMTFNITTISNTTLCHYAECDYADCRVLFNVMLSVVMLSVVAPLTNTHIGKV
jgi:hypothetical protein